MEKGRRREKNLRGRRVREVRDSGSLPPLLPALTLKSPKGERSIIKHKQEKSFSGIQDGARTQKKEEEEGGMATSQIPNLYLSPVFTRPY